MAPKTLSITYAADSSQVGKAMKDMGSVFAKVGATIGGAFAVRKIMDFGITAIKEASNAKVVMGQTEAAIKSTGGSANVTAQQIVGLSEKLGTLAGVQDEVVQASSNMLLTFTGVQNQTGKGNDVFNQAQQAILDMGVAMNNGSTEGLDLQAATIQVGKALNDPIKGMTALSKVGVTFTDQQKEQVKAMVESGDKMGAQKLILAELQKEFGGSAKAAGDNLPPFERLKLTLSNLAETIGTTILPFVEKFAAKIAEWAAKFQELSPEMQGLILKIGMFAAVIVPLLLVGSKLVGAFKMIGTAFRVMSTLFMTNPFILLIAAIIALVALVIMNWDTIKNAIGAAWEWIKNATAAAWEWIKGALSAAWNFIVAIFMNTNPVGIIIQHWDTIKAKTSEIWNAITGFLSGVWNNIKGAAAAIWNAITGAISGAVNAVSNTVRSIWNGVVGFITGAWNDLKSAASRIFNGIRDTIVGAIDGARNGISRAVDAIVGFFSRLWDKAVYYVNKIKEAIRSLPFVPGSPIPMVTWAEQTLEGMTKAFDQMEAPSMAWNPTAGALNVGALSAGALGGGQPIVINVGTLVGSGGMREFVDMLEARFAGKLRANPVLSFQAP